jgi:hypothetical protein
MPKRFGSGLPQLSHLRPIQYSQRSEPLCAAGAALSDVFEPRLARLVELADLATIE